ncbi:hypothetical protein LJC07_08245, partial [Christensenellaceae bacterium OttesenSCG-928-L17]|nr:hypothetical protein [Christensenellaceae bacterium OttesenSCG-928-L17]
MPANSAPLIPVVIGVTGHRNIRKEDEQPLYAAVCAQLRALRAHCPSSAITVLSSLAEGADQLCARAAVDEGCALVVPLPFAKTRYVEHFSKEGKQSFDELLALAAHSFVVEPIEQPPVDAGDGFYYRQAGMFIAAHSHALMALWDGVEYLSEDGGGTFETVRFMLEGGAFSPSQNDAYFLPQANG